MTKEIALTKGYVTLVDDKDFGWLNKFKWHALVVGDRVSARMGINRKQHIFMHTAILDFPDSDCIDHANRDPLDNRRNNLRPCTYAENGYNQGISKANTSGYKGVSWDKSTKRWYAKLKCDSKLIFLGSSKSLISAAMIYNEGAIKYHGEFAWLNEVPNKEE